MKRVSRARRSPRARRTQTSTARGRRSSGGKQRAHNPKNVDHCTRIAAVRLSTERSRTVAKETTIVGRIARHLRSRPRRAAACARARRRSRARSRSARDARLDSLDTHDALRRHGSSRRVPSRRAARRSRSSERARGAARSARAPAQASRLAAALGDLKGPFAKLGQFAVTALRRAARRRTRGARRAARRACRPSPLPRCAPSSRRELGPPARGCFRRVRARRRSAPPRSRRCTARGSRTAAPWR